MHKHGRKRSIYHRRNAGLSLIELIIAVAILTVAVGPLLHAFITSMNTNRKAREMQQVTTVAQSVMESFKTQGVSLEDICKQFNGKTTFKLYDSFTTGSSSGNIADNTPGTGLQYDARDHYVYQPEYDFVMNNIKAQNATYTADIKLTANTRGQAADGIDVVTPPDAVLVLDLPMVTSNTKVVDVLREAARYYDPVTNRMLTGTAVLDASDVDLTKYQFAKTTNIIIEDKQITADVHYDFVWPDAGTRTPFDHIWPQTDPTNWRAATATQFSASVSSSIQNPAICVFPAYADAEVAGGTVKISEKLADGRFSDETFNITNRTGRDINVSLIKQVPTKYLQIEGDPLGTNAKKLTDLQTADTAYFPRIADTTPAGSAGTMTVFTNLGKNLATGTVMKSISDLNTDFTNKPLFVREGMYDSHKVILNYDVNVTVTDADGNATTLTGSMYAS